MKLTHQILLQQLKSSNFKAKSGNKGGGIEKNNSAQIILSASEELPSVGIAHFSLVSSGASAKLPVSRKIASSG